MKHSSLFITAALSFVVAFYAPEYLVYPALIVASFTIGSTYTLWALAQASKELAQDAFRYRALRKHFYAEIDGVTCYLSCDVLVGRGAGIPALDLKEHEDFRLHVLDRTVDTMWRKP